MCLYNSKGSWRKLSRIEFSIVFCAIFHPGHFLSVSTVWNKYSFTLHVQNSFHFLKKGISVKVENFICEYLARNWKLFTIFWKPLFSFTKKFTIINSKKNPVNTRGGAKRNIIFETWNKRKFIILKRNFFH